MIQVSGQLISAESLNSLHLPPDTEMARTTPCVTRFADSYLRVCVCGCVWEQEAASVAAEAASLTNAISSPAPDSEPDEPKDTEAEETVSHNW